MFFGWSSPILVTVPYKSYIVVLAVVLSILGLAGLINSITVINISNGYFIGCWYVGLFACLAGARGMRFTTLSGLNWTVFLSSTAFIVAVIGSSLQSGEYNFLNSLEACSSFATDSSSMSCGNFTFVDDMDDFSEYSIQDFKCTGNANYYPYAATCEASYLADGTNPDAHQCACVSNYDKYDCYNFKHMSLGTCHEIISDLPEAVKGCFVIALMILFTSFGMCIMSCASFRHPNLATEDIVIADSGNGTDLTVGIMHSRPNQRGGGGDTMSVMHAHSRPTPVTATYGPPIPVVAVEEGRGTEPAQGTIVSVQPAPVQY